MTSMACAPVQFAAMDWRPNAVALQHLALARSWQTPQVASGRRQFHCYPGAGDPKGVHDEKRAIGCRNDEPQGGRRSGEERHGRRPPRSLSIPARDRQESSCDNRRMPAATRETSVPQVPIQIFCAVTAMIHTVPINPATNNKIGQMKGVPLAIERGANPLRLCSSAII